MNPACKDTQALSPIDLNFPVIEMDFKINFGFKTNLQISNFTKSENSFLFESDFGSITYNMEEFSIDRALFVAPSEHLIASNRLAMELKIFGHSETQNLQLIVLFDLVDNLENTTLTKFGFGTQKLKSMKNFDKIEIDSSFSLMEFFLDSEIYFLYNGLSTFSKCEDTLHFIYSIPSYVS